MQRAADARKQFAAWTAGQNVVTKQSKWTNFGADKPGIVPAGTSGSKQDIVVYENVIALLEDAGKAKQLFVGTMIQVGPTWRLVDLPKAVTEGAEVSDSGVFFSVSFSPRGASMPAESGVGISKAMERLVADLQEIDEKLADDKSDKAVLQSRRATTLEKLISASTDPKIALLGFGSLPRTVSASAQTGEFPQGFSACKTSSTNSPKRCAQRRFSVCRLPHDHGRQQLQDAATEGDFEALQKAYLADLEKFIQDYPASEDSAEAMIQIALSAEFSGDLKEAEKWYGKAASDFAKTLPGKKAAGAMRRLSLVGKSFGLEGTLLDGRQFSSRATLGGPVVYHCWASWCEGCIAEMRGLKELQSKYSKAKLNIVGINFDNDKRLAAEFLKGNPFPWMHLYDAGGLDSNLAVSYGILTLPVNVIVDKNGKVVKTGVHWTEIDGIIEELTK